MKKQHLIAAFTLTFCFVIILPIEATWTTQWQVGAPGRGQPVDGVGGGPDVDFVREVGGATPAPGDPIQADDDYYFAGIFPAPIGVVANDEIAFERAFVAADPNLRVHFNLPIAANINNTTRARFNFEPWTLHQVGADPRYGVEVRLNGILIQPEVLVRPADLATTTFTSPVFELGSVGATYGPGNDNVLELTGINYSATGGGNWMGMDYHMLELDLIPEPSALGLLICGTIVASLGFRKRVQR